MQMREDEGHSEISAIIRKPPPQDLNTSIRATEMDQTIVKFSGTERCSGEARDGP